MIIEEAYTRSDVDEVEYFMDDLTFKFLRGIVPVSKSLNDVEEVIVDHQEHSIYGEDTDACEGYSTSGNDARADHYGVYRHIRKSMTDVT